MQHKKRTCKSNQQKLNVQSQLLSIVKALHLQETELCHLLFLSGVFHMYMNLSKILHTHVKWKEDDQHLEVVIWCGDILCHNYQSWCLKMVLSKDQFLCYRHFVSIQEHPKTAKQDKDKVQTNQFISEFVFSHPKQLLIHQTILQYQKREK